MTNISTKETSSDTFKASQHQLEIVIGRLTKKSSTHLLNELLTESERIMVVKRFGAIFLLHQNYSPYKVSQLLGLSQPTVRRIRESYNDGQYSSLLHNITPKEQHQLLRLFTNFMLSKGSINARKDLAKQLQNY